MCVVNPHCNECMMSIYLCCSIIKLLSPILVLHLNRLYWFKIQFNVLLITGAIIKKWCLIHQIFFRNNDITINNINHTQETSYRINHKLKSWNLFWNSIVPKMKTSQINSYNKKKSFLTAFQNFKYFDLHT